MALPTLHSGVKRTQWSVLLHPKSALRPMKKGIRIKHFNNSQGHSVGEISLSPYRVCGIRSHLYLLPPALAGSQVQSRRPARIRRRSGKRRARKDAPRSVLKTLPGHSNLSPRTLCPANTEKWDSRSGRLILQRDVNLGDGVLRRHYYLSAAAARKNFNRQPLCGH